MDNKNKLTETAQLTEEMRKMNKLMSQNLRYKNIILRGLLSGIGNFLGATILTAILLSIIFSLLGQVQYIPVLGDFIINLTEYIKSRNLLS
jgi:cell division septal protein FtsQ